MKWSILTRDDLNTLRELGIKLKSGTKWEQTVGDFILEYAKGRIPVPTKDEKSEKSEKANRCSRILKLLMKRWLIKTSDYC